MQLPLEVLSNLHRANMRTKPYMYATRTSEGFRGHRASRSPSSLEEKGPLLADPPLLTHTTTVLPSTRSALVTCSGRSSGSTDMVAQIMAATAGVGYSARSELRGRGGGRGGGGARHRNGIAVTLHAVGLALSRPEEGRA